MVALCADIGFLRNEATLAEEVALLHGRGASSGAAGDGTVAATMENLRFCQQCDENKLK